MGILEIILGVLVFLFLLNLIIALIPIPRSIGGIIVLILAVFLLIRLFG